MNEFRISVGEPIRQQENMPILAEGSTLEEVKILQEKLKILNYYAGTVTGSFGISTKEAVENFQRDNNLEATGIVNQNTWDLLFELTPSPFPDVFRQTRPTLQLGSTGPDVEDLQKQLTQLLFYNGPLNGVFDANLEKSVKEFQATNKLTANGIVGRDTWSALAYLYAPLAICGNEDEEIITDTYTVKSGDTLYSIARAYNTTVAELKRLNNLTSDIVTLGQVLRVPSAEPSNVYKVRAGDTLYSIARAHNTTVDEIKKLNNLTSNTLTIDQELVIPSPTVTTPEPENPVVYTVKSGDTLYSIARANNTTVAEIKRLNDLTSDTLTIGQQLILPRSDISIPPTPVTHTVQAGDTLYSIARSYDTTVAELKRLNNLTSDVLTIGQVLTIR